ncbi:diguanylate cyclase [Pseudalkalibacillus hwajinpoensis]|uniref:diguanylate cyclase n=1 Tax=Guptibacillus hwajinpoensis TaxID=208199 RepID=UPI001CD43AB5|nr:diguanylate cyclase [Pseudalkalibacillus hwajinpoensis]MCA0992682.1 diguanylate cyclase [Pseudalkalibacillus hwajinpoensis]
MEKYKKKFVSNMKEKYDDISSRNASMTEKELYNFLHTFKGTAGTVGYQVSADKAEALLSKMNLESERIVSKEETIHLLDTVMEEILEAAIENKEKEEESTIQKMIMLINPNPMVLIERKAQLEQEGYIVFAAMDLKKAHTALYDMNPDCIIVDYQLIETDQSDIANEVKEKAELQFIPFIMTDSVSSATNRINGYRFGSDDFLDHEVSLEEYLLRVNGKIAKRKTIVHSVLTDELTGAYNRKYLDSQLNYIRYDLMRNNEKASLAIFDIDHFKSINDRFGHLIGDQVLKKLSQYIIDEKRRTDIFIRYGGEEFVLLLPDTTAVQADQFLQRLLNGFRTKNFRFKEETFSVTFSGGIVDIDGASTNKKLLDQADEALYRAKANGRNQMVIYESNLTDIKPVKTIRIAVVDDDEIIRTLLTSQLQQFQPDENYEIEVKSYREGESFFEDSWHKLGSSCLVLLDGIMPRMDGIEVLRKLRQESSQGKYTVMMLTGRKAEKDIVKALELGADDYITKPFRIGELEARIKRLIQKML